MAISMGYLQTLSEAINRVSGTGQEIVLAKLTELVEAGDYANPIDLVEDALRELEPLFEQVAETSASLTATSYDVLRTAAVGDGLGAVGYPDRNLEATREALYGIAAQYTGNFDGFIQAVQARLDYEAKRASGTTMFANGFDDPRKPRFARVPTGAETCPFCVMLASQGFVYHSAKSAGKLDHYHAHCDCRIVPQFGGESYEGYDPDEYLDQYSKLLDEGKLDPAALDRASARAKERRRAAGDQPPLH